MDKAQYTRDNSYPLSTQGLEFVQNQVLLLQKALAKVIAPDSGNYIIQGCKVNGDTRSSGVMMVNGEMFDVEQHIYYSGEDRQSYHIEETVTETPNRVVRRIVMGPSGAGGVTYGFISTKRISDFTTNVTNFSPVAYVDKAMPKGSIIMWSGTSIPTGWNLCDGSTAYWNGMATVCPDLRGRFIVGQDSRDTDYDEIHKTGGEKKHTLSVDEIPPHSHYYSKAIASNGEVKHYGSHTITDLTYESQETGSTGGNQPHENRPPYYVLAFIIKLF